MTTHTGHSFGIDIGGSGIKGAEVDLNNGEFVGPRLKIPTPQPSTPHEVATVVARIVREREWDRPVGITLPSVVSNHTVHSAANISPEWIGVDTTELFSRYLDVDFVVLNDADAAGLAEVAYGNDLAKSGAVIFLTLGTGIGSAFFLNGQLFPNTELGHLTVGSDEAEAIASSAAKEREGLKYKEWAIRLDRVLEEYEKLFNPQAFLIGGGISRKFHKWGPHLTLDTPVMPAQLQNRAGIIGAAMAVVEDPKP